MDYVWLCSYLKNEDINLRFCRKDSFISALFVKELHIDICCGIFYMNSGTDGLRRVRWTH